jgi:tRNA threonylcarbamoyladenosine biosynthesis protein TsaB
MIVLAIDTCMGACSAVVVDGDRVLGGVSEPMWRGHQERLASQVAFAMETAGAPYGALERVAATVGPGSFTGLRVGIAFAKGLSVALGIPAVGVGTLEAFAQGTAGRALVVADARRGQVYWQAFEDGAPVTAPSVAPLEALGELYGHGEGRVLLGPGADLAGALLTGAEVRPSDAPDPVAIARLGAAAPLAPIQPLYLRPPDAKLPGGVDPFAS